MHLVDPFLAEFTQEAQTTKRVLERVPEDRLAWRPHPKSYSLGELALHVAMIPGAVSAALSQDTFEFPRLPPPEAKNRAEIQGALENSESAAKDFLQRLEDTRATAMWTVTSAGKAVFAIPRIAAIRAILLNHWYHHGGQLTVYLRLLDVPVPSVYGPTADEDPFS
jgi:uncharacterized damage-inducible protein DinB